MNERQIHLRIKIKSLAEEARDIRREAKKTEGMVKWGLNHHRKTIVRRHARESLLAYGALRGVPYSAIERWCRRGPNFEAVKSIAKRFGGDQEAIQAWVDEATGYVMDNKQKAA